MRYHVHAVPGCVTLCLLDVFVLSLTWLPLYLPYAVAPSMSSMKQPAQKYDFKTDIIGEVVEVQKPKYKYAWDEKEGGVSMVRRADTEVIWRKEDE